MEKSLKRAPSRIQVHKAGDHLLSYNPSVSLKTSLQKKFTTASEALSSIRSGDRIFVGTACAAPKLLLKTLSTLDKHLTDIELFHCLSDPAIISQDGEVWTKFTHRFFFAGPPASETLKQGKAEYIPITFAQVPRLIENRRIPIDVALIQVSPPDEHGFMSLGISVDITRAAVQNARRVIAEVNPLMPRTLGETLVHMNQIHHLVEVISPIIEYPLEPAGPVAEKIARCVARIIDDGSTLQIGLGQIPGQVLKYLSNRRDLGIHSDVITEAIIDLVEKGVITGMAKSIHNGQVVASYCLGTRRLYDLIDNNVMFAFYPIDYVCDPAVISSNTRMVSITEASAVDLTGQACSDRCDGEFHNRLSTQSDFLRGAASSPGGKAIICLSSSTDDGKGSRILPVLKEWEVVTAPRSDVHYVVTEYGSAYLFGKSIEERALALIRIAHPSFRPWLIEEAKRLGYISPDHTLKSKAAYPAFEEQEVTLRNGKKALIRPSKASDAVEVEDLFHRFSAEDLNTKFFAKLASLSVPEPQHLCTAGHRGERAFIAAVRNSREEHIVGISCYYADPSTNLAEAAYLVSPEWQGIGMGTALHQRMIEYARSEGLRGFTYDVPLQNEKMIHLIAKSGCTVSKKILSDVYDITLLF